MARKFSKSSRVKTKLLDINVKKICINRNTLYLFYQQLIRHKNHKVYQLSNKIKWKLTKDLRQYSRKRTTFRSLTRIYNCSLISWEFLQMLLVFILLCFLVFAVIFHLAMIELISSLTAAFIILDWLTVLVLHIN